MDNRNITDEQNFSTKLRNKERHRTQTIPSNADINDPEYLDYDDTDDHHSSVKLDENHQIEQTTNPVKNSIDETKSSDQVQDEKIEIRKNPIESNNEITNNFSTASDEGELDEADLEDGEIHDPSSSKNKISSNDEQLIEQKNSRTNITVPALPQAKVQCRFFLQGRCHWGPNCKYIHPNNDTTKNFDSLGTSSDVLSSTNNDVSPSTPVNVPIPPTRTNQWISTQQSTVTSQFFSNQLLRGQPPTTGTESAWERGLRSAKTLRAESMRRKEQDKDFNDKKFNLTIRDALDERESDDNLLNIDRSSSMDFNLPGSNFGDQRNYTDRHHSYSSMKPHYNYHRTNNNSLNTNDHFDSRMRHSDGYNDSRNQTRNRKEKSSTKDNKSTSKRDDLSSSYKRNLSAPHHNNDEQTQHHNIYNNRRGDDWHDPWDRSRNHGGNNRRSLGDVREPSYSSTSGSSSSSSRSSRSRSHTTSSSSRSRSRSRSRPKRRSPSVTRAPKQLTTTKSSEMTKNGNKKLTSPTTTTNKFLPGRQISSHTLKKAEKSSNNSNSTNYNHSKDHHGKDSDINIKKQMKKENLGRSDSTSSSSSSDSDKNRVTHDSSSSSSDSSSSENETRISTKLRLTGEKTSIGNSGGHSTKTINRQLSSSLNTGNKTTNTKSKNDLAIRESSRNKEISTKKRRDTSSSTGSITTTKKTKLNTDFHKSSNDGNNIENSNSNKRLVKELEQVRKLISQRSTKTSS